MASQRQLSAGHSLVIQMPVVKKGEERSPVSLSVARGGWILEDLVRVVAFYDSSPGRGIVGEAILSIGAQTDSQSNIVSLLEKAQNRSRVAITSESCLET